MYKAIIFDLGKVLVPFDFWRGYEALAGLCSHPAAEVRRRIGATGLVAPFEKGLIEPADFVRQLSDALGRQFDYQDFCRAWSAIFHGQLLPDEMIESLASRYRLLLLSNTNAIHFDMIRENYAMLRHFHDLVLSYQVRAAKPETTIFETAIERAGCRPEECFYTDDIAEFVEAARKLGIDAVQFESPEQIKGEMKTRGIQY